ncbi:hypothetical protein HMPREF0091_10533 [Fannyhessea vaginae DSM 15829]|uniref:Uncharacterized protein n=1 Tax=Fannyhessea vaginae DSM 15829 TaxID=525256 RepID=F1T4E2_9ACTN|nr:hypothetical protein HMPREF0091_10533 [Fannyhessea vaginae DSM 15829]
MFNFTLDESTNRKNHVYTAMYLKVDGVTPPAYAGNTFLPQIQ